MGCGDTTTSTLFLINGELRISIKSLTGSTVTAFISLAGKQAESCWGPLPVMRVRCHTGGNIIQMHHPDAGEAPYIKTGGLITSLLLFATQNVG